MIKNIYGAKFRELRKQQNITLTKAAKDITSKSTLSLWENGKDNLSFNQVLELLKHIHTQPIEFIENIISSDLLSLSEKIHLAYVASDTVTLHRYVIKKRELSKKHPQNNDIFLEYCFTCMFYQDLSSDNIFTKYDKIRLTNILTNISEWNYKNIFYFGNTLGLLDPENINRLCSSLITYSINEKLYHQRWYDEVLAAILNSISILVRRNYLLAEKLLDRFDQMKVSDGYACEKMHAQLYRAFITYIKTKDNRRIYEIINACKALNLKELEDGFITGFKQIKQIYG
ncbi:helix-turn-helix domain-containing protein [Lactobacillus helveticus]|uniref:Transcriptional regulator n=3 Tax=Lactobacillus helveticus TaxID=1587 RepID=U6FCB5_LACHE|nr:Rgg/GadR/MutR family transcriptional regulator [Lactobacillus helveticus]MDY0992271.1 helix-turn-helix domain-containing protein [Lactobacillus helveticus]MDY1002950.1 helix-turn-helix domain-containing protein [Lactobacillus helveticus]MEB2874790.1 helix-turn-helix domain-containing protein [Lactobacillus helveticus]CDI58882.1 Transcriptional regulator [Lactobacillus helveticus CIRM-BIA 951]CDI60665.1 Transcriptional regulator [Lactobacillus helveticus CIRM-BIA 104]